jgi:hypothetical protein
MKQIYKYPRTLHIQGSRSQPGDEDLASIPFSQIADRFVVVEEKVDGANAAISFAQTPGNVFRASMRARKDRSNVYKLFNSHS